VPLTVVMALYVIAELAGNAAVPGLMLVVADVTGGACGSRLVLIVPRPGKVLVACIATGT